MALSINDINKLEQENAELKEENVKLLFDKGTLIEFCNKLTQIIDEKKESENKLLKTLQEIKEICKNSHTSASEDYYRTADKILDLITKAEEE